MARRKDFNERTRREQQGCRAVPWVDYEITSVLGQSLKESTARLLREKAVSSHCTQHPSSLGTEAPLHFKILLRIKQELGDGTNTPVTHFHYSPMLSLLVQFQCLHSILLRQKGCVIGNYGNSAHRKDRFLLAQKPVRRPCSGLSIFPVLQLLLCLPFFLLRVKIQEQSQGAIIW